MTNHHRHAVIVGGSLAGLLAAVALRAAEWRVSVFERSPGALDSRGGGIVLQPEVLDAFRFAGVAPNHALGVRSGDRIYLGNSNEVLHRTFMPQTQTSWGMLYNVMKQALPESVLHQGETLQSFEQGSSSVQAHFASGKTVSADLLVGADGSRSTVREQILPRVHPVYGGYVAWRGLVGEDKLDPEVALLLSDAFAFQQGPGHMLLQYLVPGEDGSVTPGRRRRNWVWYLKVEAADLPALMTDRLGQPHRFSMPPGVLKSEARETLRAKATTLLAPVFQTLVHATHEPYVQAIVDLQVDRMVDGRVVLVGEAACVARPHTAGSTAIAAANAIMLAQALTSSASDATMPDALSRWEAEQLTRGREMSRRGIEMGNRIMGLTLR